MLKTGIVDVIANELYEAEKNRQAIPVFTERFSGLDSELAYIVQERLIDIKVKKEKTERVGWKLGLTSKEKQKMIGVHEPSYGVLLANMQLNEDEPISVSQFIHAKIEPEIAFIFKKEVKGPHITVADIMNATAYVAPALEIIDSRFQGFKFTHADAVSDNSSSSRFIIGERFLEPSTLDLRLMGMVFKQNGQVLSTSSGAAVMGHPARAVAWLANKLYKTGQGIRPGEIVLSGAITASKEIAPGDQFSVSFDQMGSVGACFIE